MYYYYPTLMSYHWNDIIQMINENYAHEYEHNDLLGEMNTLILKERYKPNPPLGEV